MSQNVSVTSSFSEREANRAASASAPVRLAGSLFILALVALLPRMYHLGKESLWLDETASVWIASRPLVKVLAGELTNPPLYYLLLHFWITLFGAAEATIRWLSVWPSIGAVLFMYLLARRLYDERVAMLAAAFMAISPYQIYYAQETRAFALLLFLCVSSTFCFQVAVSRPSGVPSVGPWLWYGLTTIAALHTHFHAVFVLAAQNVVFLLNRRGHRSRLGHWIVIQTIVLIVFTPWLLTMLQTASTVGGQMRRYLPLKLPEAVVSFLVGDTLIPFDEAAVQNIGETFRSNAHLILAFTVGFGSYLVSAVRASASRQYASSFCAVMFLVPLLVPFIVSFKLGVFDRRYVIAASPFLYILLAAGALYLHDLARQQRRAALLIHYVGAILVVSTLGLSLYNYYFNSRFGKEQWREVVAFVETGYAPGDLVVFDPDYLHVSYGYYSRQPVAQLVLAPDVSDEQGSGWRRGVAVIEAHKRVWLIRSHLFSEAVLPRLLRTFPTASHTHFPKAKGIDVYVLQR